MGAELTPEPELLTLQEAAQKLSVSSDTVRRMIARGELPAYRYGPRLIRIDWADVKKARRAVTPTAAYRQDCAKFGGVA